MNGNFRCVLAGLAVLGTVLSAQAYDVCVVGGGAAGIAAALQAGRAGAKTLLIEQGFQVGGNMTTGGVSWPGLFHAWGRQVIDGCGWELVTNCVSLAGGTLPDFSVDPGAEHWRHQVRINIPLFVALAEEALTAAGVEIRYHTAPSAAVRTNGVWRMTLDAMGERQQVCAKVLVDATGNGTLSALCGGRRLRDLEACQPGAYTYLVNPHVRTSDLDIKALDAARQQAVADGRLEKTDIVRGMEFFIRESNVMLNDFPDGPDHGTTIANYVDGADNSTSALRTRTNMRGRASMLRVYRFLRSQPGLGKSSVVWASPEVGVRETWRVEGDFVLTGKDYVAGRTFDDAVCYSFYPIDLHTAKDGVMPRHQARGTFPTIPLRALIVKGVENLLVAGRCISTDRPANSAVRVQATCMATGQVAGEAAALAAKLGCEVRKVPLARLREQLCASGAIVPDAAESRSKTNR